MSFRQMHIAGNSKTACGRANFRTPMSVGWKEFKEADNKCEKCNASRVAELNRKNDAKKEQEALDAWVPEDQDAWKKADDALIENRKK